MQIVQVSPGIIKMVFVKKIGDQQSLFSFLLDIVIEDASRVAVLDGRVVAHVQTAFQLAAMHNHSLYLF